MSLSNVESDLQAIINNVSSLLKKPESRIEELLVKLKDTITDPDGDIANKINEINGEIV